MLIYALDFETYVSDVANTQQETWVWSSAGAQINGNDVFIHHSIDETFDYLVNLKENVQGYYHNIKFDGAFWLDYLMRTMKYKQAWNGGWLDTKDMPRQSFKYMISDMGQWYSITIKTIYGKVIEFKDSLKLIPFSLKDAGKAFQVEHQKLEMEYSGYKDKNYVFTEEEKAYIINDVLCLKECLEYMFSQGHKKSTVGACCMNDFRNVHLDGFIDWDTYFPNLYEEELPPYITGFDSVGQYIHKAYKGGWCYLKKGKENTVFHNGATFDVNSLYPSAMHSMSGNAYPVGHPTFWCGNYIPDIANGKDKYFFVRIRTRFYLKKGYLPTIQIKNNPLYKSTEYLESSDIKISGSFYKYLEKDGELIPTTVELTLTCTDFKLFLEHYDVEDFEILDGCWFDAISGIFDRYIDHYADIKKNNKGALRTLAKLFLNNLYGQFAKSNDSTYKKAFLNEDDEIKFITIPEFEKKPGYIPIGAAITSYAREFTIRTAQKNYINFIYSDTDSVHLLNPSESVGFTFHDTDLCAWKKECEWDTAIFARQKTYIEIADGDIDIKCAGMAPACKQIFLDGLQNGTYQLTDFRSGLEITTGKLQPKRVKGGVVLVDTSFVMR